MAEYTVGQFAKRFGLSRTTLLYYDRMGIVSPSGRSAGNYRLYGDADLARMEQVIAYRKTGLSLRSIVSLLEPGETNLELVIQTRLQQLNEEMKRCREQQRLLLQILEGIQGKPALPPTVDKQQWIALLSAAGLDDEGMMRWHQEFERVAPEAHQDFLEALGIEASEIELIRAHSAQREAGER